MPIYYTKVDSPSHGDVRFSEKSSRFSASGLKNKFRRGSAVELSNIDSNFPLISCPRVDQSLDTNEELVESSFGNILVAHQGAALKHNKPVILTFHDLGLNHASNFDSFFEFGDNRILLQTFSVLHITAPGQERYASTLPPGYTYPSMDQMPVIVKEVADHFQIKSLIGLGAGVGSNVLLRFCLQYPDMVEGLILINPSTDKANWSEWFFQKKNIRSIRNNNRSVISFSAPESL
jgi:pimeloyl-ACP methyl ester carboxylesterase